jgi:hypothetical protein
MAPRATEREFDQLDAVYALAVKHRKPFCIPEFSRPRATLAEVRDDRQFIKRLGGRMISPHTS